MPTECPCGSGQRYADCCQPLHHGQPAASAAALMRARYSAHVLQLPAFILASWHPDSRPDEAQLAPLLALDWQGLEILAHHHDSVTFVARYRQQDKTAFHLEKSHFVLTDGQWLFHSASHPEPDRNAPCPCGSGRKYKRCCR